MISKLSLVSIGLATFALALGYGLGGLWAGAALIAALGLIWLLGQRAGWGWVASAMLVLFVGAAAVGTWLGVGAGWTLLGVVAALSAWDLDHFARRLKGAGRVVGARELGRRHLRQLLIVDGVGLLLGAVALGIKLKYGLGVALLLGLLAVLCLSRAIGFLSRESG
jgi:hypothetical protein